MRMSTQKPRVRESYCDPWGSENVTKPQGSSPLVEPEPAPWVPEPDPVPLDVPDPESEAANVARPLETSQIGRVLCGRAGVAPECPGWPRAMTRARGGTSGAADTGSGTRRGDG